MPRDQLRFLVFSIFQIWDKIPSQSRFLEAYSAQHHPGHVSFDRSGAREEGLFCSFLWVWVWLRQR